MPTPGDVAKTAHSVEKAIPSPPEIEGWKLRSLPHKTHQLFQLVRVAGDFEFISAPIPAVVLSPNLMILLARNIEKAFKVGLHTGALRREEDEQFKQWKAARAQAIAKLVEGELSVPMIPTSLR